MHNNNTKMTTYISNLKLQLISIFAIMAVSLTIGCSKTAHESQADHDTAAGHDHALAENEHGHDDDDGHHDDDAEKAEGGPNGGRLITSVDPAIEFLVKDDRNVQITLLDSSRKIVTPTNQVISLYGGERANPTILTFSKKGQILFSDQPLPNENNIPVVLQIKSSPTAPLVREKFKVNLSECPNCDYQEYACVCGHDEE